MTVIHAPVAPTHDLGGTRFTPLATPSRGSSETSIWRVSIDPGVEPTPHSLTREEIFVVLAGVATVVTGDGGSVAHPGDAIVIAPGTPFALSNGGDQPLELLCCLPVGGQAVTQAGTFTPPWAQ
jgi:quercetin dioxygenase-like cupin family protein